MMITWACMGSALSDLPTHNHPDLIEARFHLESAIELADKYCKHWNSIVWIKSKVGRKKTVKFELNAIAYDTYSELILAAINVNKYMVHSEVSASVIDSLNRAYHSIHKEHGKEVNARQLALILEPAINFPLVIKSVEKVLVMSHLERSSK